jgi:hypothetical protein
MFNTMRRSTPSSAAATDRVGSWRATGQVRANRSFETLRWSEFEQRVAPSFGEVILWGVVNAYPISA